MSILVVYDWEPFSISSATNLKFITIYSLWSFSTQKNTSYFPECTCTARLLLKFEHLEALWWVLLIRNLNMNCLYSWISLSSHYHIPHSLHHVHLTWGLCWLNHSFLFFDLVFFSSADKGSVQQSLYIVYRLLDMLGCIWTDNQKRN